MNIKKAGKRRWRVARSLVQRVEPEFELNLPKGLYIHLDGEGRIIGFHSELAKTLFQSPLAQGAVLSALGLSQTGCFEGPPASWPTELPLLKATLSEGGERSYAATLSKADDGWLLHLIDVSELVERVANQDRLLRLLRQAGDIAECLRHATADASHFVTDWMESLSAQMKLSSIAILKEEGDAWQQVYEFTQPGAAIVALPSAEVLRELAAQDHSPRHWQNSEGKPAWLVPYSEEGRVRAWLCCSSEIGAFGSWCGPEDWLLIFSQIAAPLTGRWDIEAFEQEKKRYQALETLLKGGWWEYWPEKGQVRLGASLALSLGCENWALKNISYTDWLSLIDPVDRDEFAVKLGRAIDNQPLRQQLRIGVDGNRCWYSVKAQLTVHPDDPYVVGFAINAEKTHEKEQRAQAAMARLQGFIDSAPGIIYVQSYNAGALQTSFCSASVEQILGFSSDEFCCSAFSSFVHPDDIGAYFDHIKRLLKEGRSSTQYRVLDKAAKIRWLQDEATVLRDDHGVPVEVVGVCLDATEMNEARQQLLHSAKMATLGQMATSLAHEINQPLNVMHVSLTNLRSRVAAGNTPHHYIEAKLDRIAGQLTRTAKIVDHMRVFGRQSDLQGRLFPADAAIRGAVSLLEQQLLADDIVIDVSIGDLPAVCGHVERLEQVLINLIVNASYAIRQRRKRDEALEPRIEINAHHAANGNIVISIKDNGGGIDQADLERLFEPFFTTKPAGEGTGLGLSVSYAIIKQMGGLLSVKNEGSGAMFLITLPAQPDTEDDALD